MYDQINSQNLPRSGNCESLKYVAIQNKTHQMWITLQFIVSKNSSIFFLWITALNEESDFNSSKNKLFNFHEFYTLFLWEYFLKLFLASNWSPWSPNWQHYVARWRHCWAWAIFRKVASGSGALGGAQLVHRVSGFIRLLRGWWRRWRIR